MILRGYIYVKNRDGVGIPGRGVKVYPAGTTNNSVSAIDRGNGTYEVQIDSETDPSSIAKLYDVYVDNVIKYSNVEFGKWEWVIEGYETDVDETVLFDALFDSDGRPVPATLPANVAVAIERTWSDRMGMVDSVSTTGFQLVLSPAGGSATGKFDFRIYLA